MTPLNEFVARWNAVDMPIPFVEVENKQVPLDTLPNEWASALLTSDTRLDVTLGSTPWVEETGSILVALFARSGTGRETLDAVVALLRLYFHGYVSADNRVHFDSVDGPQDIDPEADGEWWRLAFTVNYTVQTRRVEPVQQVPFDAITNAWALAVIVAGGTVSAPRRELVNAMVVALRDAGLLAKIERLWLLAAENQTAAEIDLIVQDRVDVIGEPIFTPDVGFTGNRDDADANTHLETHYMPDGSGLWTLESNHQAVYVYNDRTASPFNSSNMGAEGVTRSTFVGALDFCCRISSAQLECGPVLTTMGYTIDTVRDGALSMNRNGTERFTTPYACDEYPNTVWNLMGPFGLQYRSTDTHCVFHFGAGLTGPEVATLSDIINGVYLAGIGAARY